MVWFQVERIASDYFTNGEPALEAGVKLLLLYVAVYYCLTSVLLHQPVAPSSARSCDPPAPHGRTNPYQSPF